MVSGGWRRVSREEPCPVCGKPDWCLVDTDGALAICPRTEDGAVKRCGEAGWLHRLREDEWERPFDARRWSPPWLPSQPSSPPKHARTDLPKFARHLHKRGRAELPRLAQTLGVAALSLERLEVGYHAFGGWWSFPERDAAGEVIGIHRRYAGGSKRRLKGGKAGLTYAADWGSGDGPVLLVEGGSDVAAGLTLGLCVVGRPSNTGGVRLLHDLLADWPDDRPIIVLGEQDEKPGGAWPGRDGAIRTARELARRLVRPVHWTLSPDRSKDLRDWLARYGGADPPRMRGMFLEGLHTHVASPPKHLRVRTPSGEVVALGGYRQAVLARRRRSLDRLGYFLDRSPTGSGKSSADRTVIIEMSDGPDQDDGREAA
jgi:hypothetical protein